MPPKPRGRGTTRGRGTGRGGAASARSAAAGTGEASSTAPPTTEGAVPGASEHAVVPKQEFDDGNAASATTNASENISATVEAHAAPLATASAISSPQTATDSPARPPVQRLGSLKSVEPASRSASPAVRRGNSTRGKKAAPKPTFTGRRSKEERDALDKREREREKERNKERDAAEARKRRDKEWEEKRAARAATRGRGGYGGVVSGPFSLGSSTQERKTNHRGVGGFGAGSGSRAVRVKREDGEYSGGRSGGPSIKREEGGYVSSEDDGEAEFPRQDIDTIDISSDEDEVAPSAHGGRATLPVRIVRKDHKERVIGINTEPSNETSAKILQQAQATGQAPTVDVPESSRKGKGKAKDVEITSVRKPFKGMWQDSDESQTEVKAEPTSDDEMRDAEQVGIIDPAGKPAEKTEPMSPSTERKAKARRKSLTEPILQTDEERAEWARFQANLQHIRAELGPDETVVADASGDVKMADATANPNKQSVRDNNTYLFQIPPLMPELLPPGIKKEPSDGHSGVTAPPAQPTKPGTVSVKVEEGFTDPSAKVTEGLRFASGYVGKLRVRQSGRTTLDWGGISYELTPGNKASFLQEVVSFHVIPEKERVVEEDAGEAVSFGRVKGKFVVVPDWNQMFG